MDKEEIKQRGYLVENFRVFRLDDATLAPIPFHYHDFHKLIIFLSGTCDYIIEGREWHLAPRDIVFVRAGEIHRPIPQNGVPYERIVIYIAPLFLERFRADDGNTLARCFHSTHDSSSVMHLTEGHTHDLLFHIEKLERVSREHGFANGLYTEMLFIEFMILLNRAIIGGELDTTAVTCDKKIQPVIEHLAAHITEPVDIDALAAKFFISRSYLMHRFKDATGYGVRQYVTKKRLHLSRTLLIEQSDEPVASIGTACGFTDYLSFLRAFKKEFKENPDEYRKAHQQ